MTRADKVTARAYALLFTSIVMAGVLGFVAMLLVMSLGSIVAALAGGGTAILTIIVLGEAVVRWHSRTLDSLR